MSNNLIAFVSGFGSGYMKENNRARQEKKDDEDRSLRNEASRLQIDAAKKQVSDQAALATAGKPIAMTEGAGGMLKPETMDNRDVGLPENAALPNAGLQVGGYNVAGKQFVEPLAAQTELATQNSPEATQKRILAAQYRIDPLKAMDAENLMTQRGRETIKFTQEQETYAKKLKDEGAIDALKSLRTGDGAGMVSAFNKGGQYKIEGDPVITTVERDIFGDGKKVPTFSAAFNIKGKDGALTPMTVNSHDLGMSLMPYEKWHDAQMKVKESNSKGELRVAQAENMALRGGIAASRGSGGGKGGGADTGQSPGGINMDAVDKQLTSLFTKDDPSTGVKGLDTNGLMLVRSLATRMPAATDGDSNGAALQAYNAYAAALTKAGGNHGAAVQLLNAAMSPSAATSPATVPPVIPSQEANIKKHVKPPPPAAKEAPAGGYVKPAHYVGIEKIAPRRGSPGGYSYQGKQYATEQEALAAYENSKAQILATKQGMR